jgi:hypothetical protein
MFPHLTDEANGQTAGYVVGDMVNVRITKATSMTLVGEIVA